MATPEIKKWILEQSAHHTAHVLWESMIQSGWQKKMSAEVLKEVLNINLLEESVPGKALPHINLEGMPLYLDAGDKKVSILSVIKNPHIVVLGDVLSVEECDQLIDYAKPKMQRSQTVDVKTGGDEINEVRTSNGMFFTRRENNIVTVLESRISKLLDWPEDRGEGLQILQYGPHAEYKPHYDYFDRKYSSAATILKRGGQRLGTFIVYLKEPESGGGTVFPDVDFEVLPRKGNAVFFNYPVDNETSKTLHGGSPVLKGEKWIATKWLREGTFT